MLATDGFCPLRLPVEIIRSGRICSMDSPAAVLALARGGVEPLQGYSRMFSRSVSAIGEEREQ